MNRNDLYDSFNEIDDDILERSESAIRSRKKSAWLKWSMTACLCAATCLCAAAVIALPHLLPADFREESVTPLTETEELPENASQISDNGLPTDSLPPLTDTGELPDKPPGESGTNIYGDTSDTYANLPELLAYLSAHDIHNDRKTDGVGTGSLSPALGEPGQSESIRLVESTGIAVNISGEYAYHIGESSVYISRLDGEHTENVGSMDAAADAIFVCNDSLLVLSRYHSDADELNQEMSVRVGIYDITVPQEPVLLDEYTQLGELTACWMSGADLYLITSDGVCACGWSRLDDPTEYYPSLSHGGETAEWKDDDISILGEPTGIHYSAITVINGNSREVITKEALYGNIQSLFYGADWIAAVVAGQTETLCENPVIYTFDRELNYTGKINVAQIINAPETNTLEDYIPKDGGYLNIVSVTKSNGIYRMLGTYSVQDGENTSSHFMAIAADTETGDAGSRLLSAENYPHGLFTEIIWEESRAIACIGTMKNGLPADTQLETRFLFVEFDGLNVTFHENGLTADYLSSRVGVGYGNPFGEFKTLIPMGNGIYIRYSDPAEGPGGFDVFDFTDSAAPSRLYSPEVSLSSENAFDYVWYVYDENTFGTLKVLLGPDDYFRNVKLSWCVYLVDTSGDTKITLQKEYFLDGEIRTFFGADALGWAVFPIGKDMYYVMKNMDSPALIQ